MATTISNIRAIKGAGVLADRDAHDPKLEFRRQNLIYGFNGSGKSTLSRLFASLDGGATEAKLPSGCQFEFELDDGRRLTSPDKLSGLERRVLVFNADFVERNLRWNEGSASPIFYIGREQAELATQLEAAGRKIPPAEQRLNSAAEAVRTKEKQLADFKKDRAKLVAQYLWQPGRKYEATQLAADFKTLDLGPSAALDKKNLDETIDLCRRAKAIPRLDALKHDDTGLTAAINDARQLAGTTFGAMVMPELQQHPTMVRWVKQGHEYHEDHELDTCLHCGAPLSRGRSDVLERALDNSLNEYLERIDKAHVDAQKAEDILKALVAGIPPADAISGGLQSAFTAAADHLEDVLKRAQGVAAAAGAILERKATTPTLAVDTNGLLDEAEARSVVSTLGAAVSELNSQIAAHNAESEHFEQRQNEARLAVRRHFLAEVRETYAGLGAGVAAAQKEEEDAGKDLAGLRADVSRLRSAVHKHGPAAAKVNRLIRAYLGHDELSISAVAEGYEIRRHGSPIQGSPSEGEKTAIALCYFLSTLDAEGRKLSELIVVVDDPISSLDTKALNYACNLMMSRLETAAQLFVLTHNQHCMNEFKKAWKSRARLEDPAKATATLMFLDVAITGEKRSAKLLPLPRLLREYDFEYHYLVDHVFRFEASQALDYEYAYMIPSVLRRALDVFLAFKCPGSTGLQGKIRQLCADYPSLDSARMCALERLTQVESHSDSLDDLIAFASMTLEESRDAAAALIAMMKVVDAEHLQALRRICK